MTIFRDRLSTPWCNCSTQAGMFLRSTHKSKKFCRLPGLELQVLVRSAIRIKSIRPRWSIELSSTPLGFHWCMHSASPTLTSSVQKSAYASTTIRGQDWSSSIAPTTSRRNFGIRTVCESTRRSCYTVFYRTKQSCSSCRRPTRITL